MTPRAPRRACAALMLAAGLLAGCQSVRQDASLRYDNKAQPYARTWAEPGWPRPDLPPDRDGGKD